MMSLPVDAIQKLAFIIIILFYKCYKLLGFSKVQK